MHVTTLSPFSAVYSMQVPTVTLSACTQGSWHLCFQMPDQAVEDLAFPVCSLITQGKVDFLISLTVWLQQWSALGLCCFPVPSLARQLYDCECISNVHHHKNSVKNIILAYRSFHFPMHSPDPAIKSSYWFNLTPASSFRECFVGVSCLFVLNFKVGRIMMEYSGKQMFDFCPITRIFLPINQKLIYFLPFWHIASVVSFPCPCFS